MEELKLAWCIILFLLKNYNLCTHRPLPYFSLCGFLFFFPRLSVSFPPQVPFSISQLQTSHIGPGLIRRIFVSFPFLPCAGDEQLWILCLQSSELCNHLVTERCLVQPTNIKGGCFF